MDEVAKPDTVGGGKFVDDAERRVEVKVVQLIFREGVVGGSGACTLATCVGVACVRMVVVMCWIGVRRGLRHENCVARDEVDEPKDLHIVSLSWVLNVHKREDWY